MRICTSCHRLSGGQAETCLYCHTTSPAPVPALRPLRPFPLETINLNGELFSILGEVGRGGFGVVLAVAKSDNQQVQYALKMPSRFLALEELDIVDPEEAERSVDMLRDEIKLVSSVHHPSVISVVREVTVELDKYQVTHRLPGYLMELAEGNVERLIETLPREALSVDERLKIARQMLAGLAALHRSKIVHRDISLRNVLVIDRGRQGVRYVWTDFGTARTRSAIHTSGGNIVATPRYTDPALLTSPEQLGHDPRIDVYAFGIAATEVLLGVSNWTTLAGGFELGTVNFATEILRPRIESGEIPTEIGRILMRATARDPKLRFADANQMAEQLESVGLGRSTAADNTNDVRAVVRFLVTIPLPLPDLTRTAQVPEDAIELRMTEAVRARHFRTERLKLPPEVPSDRRWKVTRPSFYYLAPVGPGQFLLRLNPERLRKVLSPLLEVAPDAQGELVFEGEVAHE